MTFDAERHFKRKAEIALASARYAQARFGTDHKVKIERLATALAKIDGGTDVYSALAPCLPDLT